jgi:hypothetical protein
VKSFEEIRVLCPVFYYEFLWHFSDQIDETYGRSQVYFSTSAKVLLLPLYGITATERERERERSAGVDI